MAHNASYQVFVITASNTDQLSNFFHKSSRPKNILSASIARVTQTLMSVTCGTVDVLRPVATFLAASSVCVSTDTTTYTATAPNA